MGNRPAANPRYLRSGQLNAIYFAALREARRLMRWSRCLAISRHCVWHEGRFIVKNSYESLGLTLKEEHKLRMFGNRGLSRVLGPKSDEVKWRKLHNLYSSKSIIRIMKSLRIRWEGNLALIRGNRNACRLLVGKPEGKWPVERPRRRWVDNIKMDLGEIGWGSVDWICLAHDRNKWRALVNAVMNI
jgi:hypothetical protein